MIPSLPPTYVDHLVAPRHLGDLLEPEAAGEIGSMVGGMGVRVTLAYRAGAQGEAVIRASAARVFGSAAPVAPASRLMELLRGMRPEEAHEIAPEDLTRDLAGDAACRLPQAVHRGAQFAIRALQSALATAGERPADPRGPGILVCRCLGVGDRAIRDAIRRGATTPEEVGDACRAGQGCGSCRSDVLQLIHEARCHRRLPPTPDRHPVERIVFARVAPLLEACGVDLRDVLVTDGAVRLQLSPAMEGANASLLGAQAIARHLLRETVCERIQVEVERVA